MSTSVRQLIKLLISEARLSNSSNSLGWKFDEARVREGQYEDCWSGVEMFDGIPLRIDTSHIEDDPSTGEITVYVNVFYENDEVWFDSPTYDPESDDDFVEVLKQAGLDARLGIRKEIDNPNSTLRRAIENQDLLRQLPPWQLGRWSNPNASGDLPEKIVGWRLDVGPFQLIVPSRALESQNPVASPLGATNFPVIFVGREGLDPKGQRGSWIIKALHSPDAAKHQAETWLASKLRRAGGIEALEDPDYLKDLFEQMKMNAL